MDEKIVDAILKFGDRYKKEHLYDKYNVERIGSCWWDGLVFFFDHIFYQGRRDDISTRVRNAAIKVLEPEKGSIEKHFMDGEWSNIKKKLEKEIGKHKIGKGRDIVMVLDALKIVSMLRTHNIVSYSVQKIRDGCIHELINELRKITQVGPKVVAFYLRDIVSLFDMENYLDPEDLVAIQPVDVWVRRIAYRINLVEQESSDIAIQKAIVQLCRERGESSIAFNQGAWLVGSKAFDLLLERLSTQP